MCNSVLQSFFFILWKHPQASGVILLFIYYQFWRLLFPFPFHLWLRLVIAFIFCFTACELTNSTAFQLLNLNSISHFMFLLSFCFRFDTLSINSWVLWLISFIAVFFWLGSDKIWSYKLPLKDKFSFKTDILVCNPLVSFFFF